MKKIIFSIVAIAAVTISSVTAQNSFLGWSFGPKVGMNVTNLSKLQNKKTLVGFTGGGFVEYGFNDWFGLSADLLYSRQGVKFKNYTIGDAKITKARTTLDYLNIPIMANFYVLEGFALKTGLQPGFLLGAKNIQHINGAKKKESINKQCKKFDLTIPIGISYTFDFGLMLEARYGFGVTKVFKYKGAPKSKNSVFTLSAGWRF